MLFAIMCNDKPDCLNLRLEVRPDHLAYLKSFEKYLKICGPLSNNEGKSCGSLIIIDMETRSEVEQFAENDPYAKANLFESVVIRPFKIIGSEGKIL